MGIIIDISPTIHANLAVFPGDTSFSRKILMDFSLGHHLQLSSMETTLHLGAHADAPNHYHAQGVGIAERSLSYYLGKCQVIEVPRKDSSFRLYPEDLTKANKMIRAKRVLFSTNSFSDENQWRDDFTALSPELIHWLADQGVILVGIDTPSVDPSTSKNLETHQSIYQRNLAILEGIVLKGVKEGLYSLVALPLKIKDADASPVRAVLLTATDILED